MEENQYVNEPAQTFSDNVSVNGGIMENDMMNNKVSGVETEQNYAVTGAVQSEPVQTQAEPQAQQPMETNLTKIVVKTSLLKSALKKADTVASKVDLQPITEVVMFRVIDGQLMQVRATDRDNILTVNVPVVEATVGAVMTLKISQLKPLIDKLSCEEVTFVINGITVKVISGNGEYNYQQALDLTTNDVIVVPDVDKESILLNETIEISKEQFMPQIESVYPIVKVLAETSPYAAIHFGELVSATTGDDIAVVKDNISSVFGTTAFIKLSTVKEIMSMGVGDKINIGFGTLGSLKTMCIYTSDYRLYSVLKEGEEEYPTEDISNVLNAPKGTAVKLNKTELLASIDRLSTFFNSNVTRQSLDVEVSNGRLKISNENKAFETFPVANTQNVNIKFDTANLIVVLNAIKSNDIYIEPIQDGDPTAPVSLVQISDGAKELYVIGTAL